MLFDGINARPATQQEREERGANDGDILYIAEVWRKGSSHPFTGTGRVKKSEYEGKTYLTCAIAHRILDRWNGEKTGCPVSFIAEPDIYRRIQTTYNYSAEERKRLQSEQEIINELVAVPLLIIDDIGKEHRTDKRFVQRVLFSIINSRYNAQRPVVLTTNMTAGQLENYLGNDSDSATFDRIWEMCVSPKQGFIRIKAESYRRK